MAVNDLTNPYENLKQSLSIEGHTFNYFHLAGLDEAKFSKLPYSIRILLESAVRNCDNFHVTSQDVQNILAWETIQAEGRDVEVAFKPARVILQDFTGVPAVVDFAAMRDAVEELNGDPERINPICPADLVIDHSVQVDVFRRSPAGISPWDTGPGPSAPPILDLEDTALSSTTRLPVFQQLQTASSKTSVSPTPKRGTLVFSRGRGSVLRGRRTALSKDYPSCKGQCDGVTCILEAADVTALPCLQHNDPAKQSQERTIETKKNLEFGAGPITDLTCPFHKLKSAWADALTRNQDLEFERNKERFVFLKWGAKALHNMLIVPPGMGIVHQVNLEYLARVVFCEGKDSLLYPDSVVGTDSHTTMINGLGILGWGVGGIEAEAVMLGQAISMVLPPVVGYKITGSLNSLSTSTDVVLTITKHLRQVGVVGKFVEFFGPGVAELSIADRATISNMCPEYGATVGFFPVDAKSIEYLVQTNRSPEKVTYIEAYLKAVSMFRHYDDAAEDPVFSEVVELDLGTVVPSLSGPKRPHDRVSVSNMQVDFRACLTNKVGFKGFGIAPEKLSMEVPFVYENKEYKLKHGSVVIAAITSCTNTSNPSVMLGAGLLAKKAVEAGLSVQPYIKTSLSPGSGVVTYYLEASGVIPALGQLGFSVVGYGCMTCIGNSGPLPEEVAGAIDQGELVCCGVLSGNRNFEGRIHPHTRANYLASPLLVVAYAIAGTVDIDFETEPVGYNKQGEGVFLRDIYPTRSEIQEVERATVVPAMFQHVYSQLAKGSGPWNALQAPESQRYPWDTSSTYIKRPPFFVGMPKEPPGMSSVGNARVLLYLGDSVTTDHISPAGSIARNSPAARYLSERGLTPRDFNSYGSRRGNDAVMVRGTFANIRLVNRLVAKAGPRTVHFPSGQELDIFDAAALYQADKTPLIVIAGKEYGCGSSRDWAAKGPFLLGIKAVIAESFERIHRSNLVGMGIVPLQFLPDQDADNLGIKGTEAFSIIIPDDVTPGQILRVQIDDGRSFEVLLRFDTDVELTYFKHGGILNYMVRKMLG